MCRTKGAQNHGFLSVLNRKGHELEMACRRVNMNADDLSDLASDYKKFLAKAIKCASAEDLTSVPRIAAGLTALTKAVSIIDRLKQNAADGQVIYRIED